MMDNLVDIDALLGDLELESEDRQPKTLQKSSNEKEIEYPNISGLTFNHPVEDDNSNMMTNGTTMAQGSNNGIEDLLDLSIEPDFGPAPSSLQTISAASTTLQSNDYNLHSSDNLTPFDYPISAASNPNLPLVQPFSSAPKYNEDVSSTQNNTSFLADGNFLIPSTIPMEKPESYVLSKQCDDLLNMTLNTLPQSASAVKSSNLSISADTVLSTSVASPNLSEFGYIKTDLTKNDAFPKYEPRDNLLPYEQAGNGLLDSRHAEQSDNTMAPSQVTTLVNANCKGGGQSDFLPLTEDLVFLDNYEDQKIGAKQFPHTQISTSNQEFTSADHSLSFSTTLSQASNLQPTAPSFSSDFGLPSDNFREDLVRQIVPTSFQSNDGAGDPALLKSDLKSKHSEQNDDHGSAIEQQYTSTDPAQIISLLSGLDISSESGQINSVATHGQGLNSMEEMSSSIVRHETDTCNNLPMANSVLSPDNFDLSALNYSSHGDIVTDQPSLLSPLQAEPINPWDLHSVGQNVSQYDIGSNPGDSLTYGTSAQVLSSLDNMDSSLHTTSNIGHPKDSISMLTNVVIDQYLSPGDPQHNGVSSLNELLTPQSNRNGSDDWMNSNLRRDNWEQHPGSFTSNTNSEADMMPGFFATESAPLPGTANTADLSTSELNADEEFNSLLAANGYPISQSSKQANSAEDLLVDANLSGAVSLNKAHTATDSVSASPTINPLLKNTSITGSVDSFTRLQYTDMQQPIDSFTALHNISVSQQSHRNSLLEQNGIIPSSEVPDMGWDIGATHTVVAEDVFADLGLDDPVIIDSSAQEDPVGHIDELAPGELPPNTRITGFVEEDYSSYPESSLPLHTGGGALGVEDHERMPTTADLQSMVVQDEPPEEVPDSPHPTDMMPVPGEEILPPPYQINDPAFNPSPQLTSTPARAIVGADDFQHSVGAESVDYLDLGATKPYWLPDSETTVCMACQAKFTFRKRKHHCRSCGEIFCDNCCNLKSPLQYMDFKEARVCKNCHDNIAQAAEQQARLFNSQTPEMEHTGTTPPGAPIQATGAVGGAEAASNTPDIPAGVLKDTSSNRAPSNRESNRSVIFSDGIRPGDDNTHLDGSDVNPSSRVRRKAKNRQKASLRLRETLRNTFLIPDSTLPPLLCYDNDSSRYSAVDSEPDELGLITKLREEGDDGRFAFAIHKDLNIEIKIVDMDCCTKRQCWCFTSHGLNTVSQDEVVLVLECLPNENCIPRDVFYLYKMLYQQAAAGQQVTELGFADLSKVDPFEGETGFLGSKEHTGLLFIRCTFQCLKGLCLPDPPYLFAILIHTLEIPWARLFPVRLKLRLGAEFKYYPCPLMSVRGRPPVYGEINNTIMNLLADFHTYKYSVSKIEGFTVHLMDKITTISIPKNMYPTVMKVVGASQECVVAFGASFSTQADSHIVCMQNADGTYSSRTMNIRDQQRTVTGASFVVFSGSMKESYGMSAKCSIVEDGIMVQITKEALDELKAKVKNMQEYTVICGRTDDSKEQNEQVKLVWVDDYKDYNLGVISPIDDFPMDGVMSLRVKSFNDLTRDSFTIRWTEVFFVQVDESRLTMDTMEITQFSETVANSTCSALAPFLGQLHEQGMKKVALRVTLGPEQVEYICGSLGQKLILSELMNNLDAELVPVLHSAATVIGSSLLVLELIFHVLE